MTEEEFFISNYPDSCYGNKPLSPHWDFFQDGVAFGERQSEKKIEELKARLNAINLITPELEKVSKLRRQQLTKAKEIIRELIEKVVWFDNCFDLKAEAEQFLNEVEK